MCLKPRRLTHINVEGTSELYPFFYKSYGAFEQVHVKQLAKKVGVTPDTVRFYTRIGYLKPTKTPSNGFKQYRNADLSLLRFILSARQLGFSVDDIGQLLDIAEEGKSPCPLARALIQQRLKENEKVFTDSAELRQRMLVAINGWNKQPDRPPTGNMICHLIQDFGNGGGNG